MQAEHYRQRLYGCLFHGQLKVLAATAENDISALKTLNPRVST